MDSSRLPIVVYLNQKYCFDLLAMIEDGLTQLETIRTTESEGRNVSSQASGEIGAKDVFAFVGVRLGGGRKTAEETGSSHETAAEKVHTPNSLFAKVREYLRSDGTLKDLDVDSVSPGEFVEFRLTLRKNPLVANLEAMMALWSFATLLGGKVEQISDQPGTQVSGSSSRQNKRQAKRDNEPSSIMKQLEGLLDQLNSRSHIDLIGKVGATAQTAVLTIDRSFLSNESAGELVDGEFAVLGKVTRVILSNNVQSDPLGNTRNTNSDKEDEHATETFDLLRNTTLASMGDEHLGQILSVFENLNSSGINIPVIGTEELRISGPAIQVVPIAIFA